MAERAKKPGTRRAARLASVTLSGVPAFGARTALTLELEPGVTVLVGRNGAGKSAILTGITTIAAAVLRDPSVTIWPRDERRSAAFQLHDPKLGELTYTCRYDAMFTKDGPSRRWTEACSTTAGTLWSQAKGRVFAGDDTILVPEGVSYLGTGPGSPEAKAFLDLFRSFTIVPSGLPRASLDEGSPAYSFVRVQGTSLLDKPRDRVRGLVSRLVSWHLGADPALAELNAILRRLKLLREPIEVVVVPLRKGPERDGMSETFAHVQAEGLLDLLDLSDGTLRVIEILASVLGSAPGSVTFVEEPETGIHPGLLGKIVDELKAYAHDRQIVIATHSADVVSKLAGTALRLVSRLNGRVQVRRVTAPEAKRIKAFLEDGNLGEFVFGGGLGEDDEA
jgi:ABC-type Mn2+/Zn2+ transport system ATPase subunit